MLRPIAQTGHDPVYSMGDDAPIAPLAGRARPLASYFRQRFAQVTNPAIDHTARAGGDVGGDAARAAGRRSTRTGRCRTLIVLPGFLLTPAGLEALGAGSDRDHVRRGRGLGAAVERVADACVAAVAGRRGRSCASPTPRPAASRRADPVAARRRGGARAPGRARACGPRCSLARRERRAARHAHDRDAARLRRGRDLPAARARDRRCTSPRSTRSAATGRRPRRRSDGCSRRSRTACSR